jgi:hypothetical protein
LHRFPVLILLAAGLGAGAACSGTPDATNGVASIKTAADKNSESDQDAKKDKENTSPEDAMLAFARCMREHGVNIPDPDTSGGGGGAVTFASPASQGSNVDIDTENFQAADKACRDLLGDGGPQDISPQQQQEMQDQALAFSRCMREHGVNMPDPTFGAEGQMTMKIDRDSGVDPSDPKFEAAQQACGSAYGPPGTKGGPGNSVTGKADGSGGKGGPSGAISFGGAPSASSSDGAK